MAEFQSKLEITAKVVDLGDRVIQLHHIVSAGVHARHPLRGIGLLLIAIAAGLVASEGYLRGAAAFKLQSGGSLPLWIGFGAAGIGLFLSLYARRNLLIRTADGGRFVLPASDDETAAALIGQLRHAMEAAGSASAHGPAPSATPMLGVAEQPAVAQKASVPLGLPQHPQPGQQPVGRAASPSEQTAPHTQPSRLSEGYANGHAARSAFPQSGGQDALALGDGKLHGQRKSATAQQGQALSLGERRGTASAAGATGAVHQPAGREPLSLPSTSPMGHGRDDGQYDLASLMDHVRRSDVQHKEALLDLLRVVEDYYRGRATREDAVAHWRSFADYVVQYLSDVDGLIGYTERFGRHMLSR